MTPQDLASDGESGPKDGTASTGSDHPVEDSELTRPFQFITRLPVASFQRSPLPGPGGFPERGCA